MAERTTRLGDPVIRPYTVAAGKTVTEGLGVKFDGADDQIENAAAVGDDCFGIALESGTAGQVVRVALFGKGAVRVKGGSAGLARGAFAKYSATGAVAATVGGGTGKLVVWGQALQNGVSGDFVTLNLGMAGATVGS